MLNVSNSWDLGRRRVEQLAYGPWSHDIKGLGK